MNNKKVTRRFLGKLVGYNEYTSKLERDFEKAHLKAYIRGAKFFRFRFRDQVLGDIVTRVPAIYETQFQIIED